MCIAYISVYQHLNGRNAKTARQAIFQCTQMRFESNSNALVCMTADLEHESHEISVNYYI